ncbi:hypothetical protein MKK65_10580 [Methylobacterium sp. J-001]|uniref:hypothetical protein n=1 Tax=Methylobacterium sp. J-001 TaxID=2836609 RepID=UPI001FB90631|nr:hypothetical protein [Methylobacterium sp. J-001]MCJ2117009.1 hypothetical protein [Methylobacterium sp. J-001]
MDITIDWQPPVQLTKAKTLIIDADDLPEEIENIPGVYYFSRRHGPEYTPFYIGETLTIRSRLKSHLNSVSIVDVLRGVSKEDDRIRQGSRHFHYGYFVGKSRQDAKTCIQIVQKMMIRLAVENGTPILNKQLTKIKTHEISFEGSGDGRGWYEASYTMDDS